MKTKAQVIEYMTANKLTYLTVVVNPNDELGFFVRLSGKRLVDPWNKAPKWKECWGIQKYAGEPGKFDRQQWDN